MAKEQVYKHADFGGGLYLRDDQNTQKSHCIECSNVWTPGGVSLEKRPGTVLVNSTEQSINGPVYGITVYRDGSTSKIIVCTGPSTSAGKRLYYVSGSTLVRIPDIGGYEFELATGGQDFEAISYDGVLYCQNGVDDPFKITSEYGSLGVASWGVPEPDDITFDSLVTPGGNFDSTTGTTDTYGFRICFYDSVTGQRGEFSNTLAVTATSAVDKVLFQVNGIDAYRGYDTVLVYISEGQTDVAAVNLLSYTDFYYDSSLDQTIMDGTRSAVTFTGAGLDDCTAGGSYTGKTGTVATPSVYEAVVEGTYQVSIDAFTTAPDSKTLVTTATIHGISTGSNINISGTTNYNGDFVVEATSAAETFIIDTSWVADDGTGTIETFNTFKWRKDTGTYTTGVEMTGSAQEMDEGVTVAFTATVGHTENEWWSIDVSTWLTEPIITALNPGTNTNAYLDEAGTNNVPKTSKYMAIRDSIIYMAGDADALSTLSWTDTDNPLVVPTGNSTISGNWVALDTDAYGGPITSVRSFGSFVAVMKQDATYPMLVLGGRPQLAGTIIPRGTISHKSAVVCEDGSLRFIGSDDIYEITPSGTFMPIGWNIEPDLKLLNNINKRNSAGVYWRYHYIPSFYNTSTESSGLVRPYGAIRKSWWEWTLNPRCFCIVPSDIGSSVPDRLYFGSATTGKVYYFDDDTGGDNGVAISTSWKSGAIQHRASKQDKMYLEADVKLSLLSGFVSVTVGVDEFAAQQIDSISSDPQPQWGEFVWGDGTQWATSQTKREAYDLAMELIGDTLHFKIINTDTAKAWKLHAIMVLFNVMADDRQA